MALFDTHAHYDAEEFAADRDAVLSALPSRGVSLVVNPGCDLPSSRAAVDLSRRYPHVCAAVGYHPENCAPYQEEDLDILRDLSREEKVVAIGEIGLDYYWEENPSKELQQVVFRDQLKLAEELNLPVIVHDREAHVPLFLWQRGAGAGAGKAGVDGVLHRGSDLQERPTERGGRGGGAAGPADDRDGQPLHGPGALPGTAERLGQCALHLREAGGDQGHLPGGVRQDHHGEREAVFLNQVKKEPAADAAGSFSNIELPGDIDAGEHHAIVPGGQIAVVGGVKDNLRRLAGGQGVGDGVKPPI